MVQFSAHEEMLAGSPTVPRSVCDPPISYANFQPSATSELRTNRSVESTDANVNKLSTLLNDMQDVIIFAKNRFLRPRITTLTNFKDDVEKNKSVLEVAENSLHLLDEFVKLEIDTISDSLCEWGKKRKYYTEALNLSCDPPSQNMKRHPEINQQTYVELVKKMVHLCCKIERELKLAELQMCNMDELSLAIRKVIQCFRRKVDTNTVKVEQILNEQYVELYCLLEKTEQEVDMFKREWQKDGRKLNTAIPRLYTAQPPLKDENLSPPYCSPPKNKSASSDEQRSDQTPHHSSPSKTTNVQNNKPRTPIDPFTFNIPSSKESGPRAVKDIVGRYNAMQLMVRDEVNNVKDQQQFINKIEADLEKQSPKI